MEGYPRLIGYTLARELSIGTHATVYLATTRSGSRCAVKVYMSPKPAEDCGIVQDSPFYLRELEFLLNASHPNLIGLLDFGKTLDPQRDFLVLQWADGQDFVSGSKSVSRKEFYSLILQVCRGLEFMHRLGFIHADLTPRNLIITRTESGPSSLLVKILDFGYTTRSASPSSRSLVGCPYYVAPEIIRGNQPSVSSDLYAFGVILYQCLAEHLPFNGPDVGSILRQHVQDSPPPLPAERLPELHGVISQLLSKDPERRPRSVADVLRLINIADSESELSLHTPDTWLATTASSSSIGRQSLANTCREILTKRQKEHDSHGPFVILAIGNPGTGKSRFLRDLALYAIGAGYHVHTLKSSNSPALDVELRDINVLMSDCPHTPPLLIFGDDADISTLTVLGRYLQDDQRSYVAKSTFVLATRNTTASLNDLQPMLAPSGTFVVHLNPFSEETIRLATQLSLGVCDVAPDVSHYLFTETGGNPWLWSRLLAASLASGVIHITRGTLTARTSLTTSFVPEDIALFLLPQLRNLDQPSTIVLRILSTARTALSCEDLAILMNLTSSHVNRVCVQLVQTGLLQQNGDQNSTFMLASNLLCSTIQSLISTQDLRHFHLTLGRWYAQRHADPRSIELAASHLFASGAKSDALHYSLTAARTAARRADHCAATTYYANVLELEPNSLDLKIESTLGIARAEQVLGRLREALQRLDSLSRLSNVSRDWRIRIALQKSQVAMNAGDYYLAEDTAMLAVRLIGSRSLGTPRVDAQALLGSALCRMERRTKGLPLLFRSAILSRRLDNRDTLANILAELAACYWKSGDYHKALNYQRRSARVISASQSASTRLALLLNLGILLSDLGFYSKSRASHLRCQHIALHHDLRHLLGLIWNNLGESYRAQGQWRRAYQCYRKGHSASVESGPTFVSLTIDYNLANAFLMVGHYSNSLMSLKHLIAKTRSIGSKEATTGVLLVWASVLYATGRWDLAERVSMYGCRFSEALHLDARILEFKVFQALALLATGHLERAHACISSALREFERCSAYDVRMMAQLAFIQIEWASGISPETLESRIEPLIARASMKKMAWHTSTALTLRAQGRLAAGRTEDAAADLGEAIRISRTNADRPNFWKASYWMGRVFEQRLQYERALACYRVAALTVDELARDIEDDRYREAFLAQAEVREVIARHERLRDEVGRKARHDIATMRRSEKISRRMLDALNAIGQKLSSILDLDDLLANLLDLSIDNVRAERGMVFLRDEATGEMTLASARGMDRESLSGVSSFSRSVIKKVAEGQTMLKVDVPSDPSLSSFKSLVIHEIKSILCVPMRTRGRTIGVIYLDTRKAAQMFTDKERTFVESFASQAAIAIENARVFGMMSAENDRLQREVAGRSRFEDLIGATPVMQRLCESIAGVLRSDCNVLILGESGTGKELVAEAIHYNGSRQKKKFVAIDCGALPDNLLEAELFGFARGAFTGADRDRVGLIEDARGGTLFLDEITNTSLAVQARLLRVLQEREIRRLGENTPRQVDIRILAATNADIENLIKNGRFRPDLFYRLNVVTIDVPPLRDRRADIPLLVDNFLKKRAGARSASKRFGPGVVEALCRYDWPGNVRELENVLERLLILAPNTVISLDDLPEMIRTAAGLLPVNGGNGHKTGEQMMIEEALHRFAGDKTKAARFIGWNRQKLYRKIKAYAIPADYGQSV